MKYTLVLVLIALIVATVQATSFETNAQRMARGLPPRAPRKLYRDVTPAQRMSSVLCVLVSVSCLSVAVAVLAHICQTGHLPSSQTRARRPHVYSSRLALPF